MFASVKSKRKSAARAQTGRDAAIMNTITIRVRPVQINRRDLFYALSSQMMESVPRPSYANRS